MNVQWLVATIVPFAIAWLAIRLLGRSRWAARLADHPNERSLHSIARPRVGGIGVMLAALPAAAWGADRGIALVLACALALALVSLADDLRGLPVAARLGAHLAAALAAVIGAGASMPIVAALVAAIAIAWMTDLFNFMDGADGLAGGMALIGFSAYGFAAFDAGAAPLAFASVAIACASCGFLAHNFPPARVFLGDAGSIPLGFLAGALGLAGYLRGAWPAWFPVLVFSPFIADASLTLARRLLRRERVWRAHRDHYYQRLVLSGWSHRRLALLAYPLMAGAAGSALLGRGQGAGVQCAILLGWVAVFGLLLFAIESRLPPGGRGARRAPERRVE